MQKALYLCILLVAGTGALRAQILDPNETVKRKATNRANSRIDQGVDKGLDKVEEGIGSLFRKKDKKNGAADAAQQPEETGASGEETTRQEQPAAAAETGFAAYSKFDFVPGENVLFSEDFGQDAIGDFPAHWNTNASGEVVTLSNTGAAKWLMITQNGLFYPEYDSPLPEHFTLEMDLAVTGDISANDNGNSFYFVQPTANPFELSDPNRVELFMHPGNTAHSGIRTYDAAGGQLIENNFKQPWSVAVPNAHLSVWRQKTRLRVYVNEIKVLDLPRAFASGVPYRLLMARNYWGEGAFYVSALRLAEGTPDARSKLISEGRFSTTGILFDSNSDQIKSSSYAVLKDIAATLTENPAITIRIIGHTDSDGTASGNLVLSQARARAVKNALVTAFGIAASRMETDGKGASESLYDNSTSQGKANNRRVEFVKL